MREIRPSGSEGGGIEFNRFSLPLSVARCRPEGWRYDAGQNSIYACRVSSTGQLLSGGTHGRQLRIFQALRNFIPERSREHTD